jgi:SAM-dependent methyltransferase
MMEIDEIRTGPWEESYSRKENYLFYPREEVVKFLNRFVRKRIGVTEFHDLLDSSRPVRALDYGCGIGRHTLLLREFGIEAYGVDVSRKALSMARTLSEHSGFPELINRFVVVDGRELPFVKDFFDFTIADSVLDSMTFPLAKQSIREIDRVTQRYAFISLIRGNDLLHGRDYSGEEVVQQDHEKGTVQSYFNWHKINLLLESTGFSILWCHLLTEESVLSADVNSRYYLVLAKK